jgi:beta-lactam-binding protein with PASTA domain
MAKNIGRGNKVFRRATIPNVVGQNKTTAESTLSALGINYSTTVKAFQVEMLLH